MSTQAFQGVSQISSRFWQKPVLQAADGTYFCPGIDGDTYLTNPWDSLLLGVSLPVPYTPGKCIVNVEKARDADKKKAAGNDGARVTIHGADLASVEIELQIWTPEQHRQLHILWPLLFPLATKGSPPSFDVYHPALAQHGIKAIQFIGGRGPTIDEKRVGHFYMRAIEFLKPSTKNVTKTETAALGSRLDPGVTSYQTPGSTPANLGP